MPDPGEVMTGGGSYSVVEVRIDVSDAVPGDEPCSIAATLFVPHELDDRPTVVVAVPGASLRRRYFDLEFGGLKGYSEARYFADRGFIFAAMDYLGGGDSSRPAAADALTISVLADAAHLAVVGLGDGLRAGTWLGRKIASLRLVANGFSFGGAISIAQQARYEDFEAMLVRAYSPLATDVVQQLPDDWEQLSVEAKRAFVLKSNEEFVGGPLPAYHPLPRAGVWESFYPEDVTEEMVRYDAEELETVLPRSAGVDVMTKGFVRQYSTRITVPLFLAFGEQDVVGDLHIQPTAYPSCSNLTLTTYPGMTHLHNFCGNRLSLWDRSIAWMSYVEADQPIPHQPEE